jgi:hypothetical protein
MAPEFRLTGMGFFEFNAEGLSATSPEMKRQIKALEGQYPSLPDGNSGSS